jgi:hypothetical protein
MKPVLAQKFLKFNAEYTTDGLVVDDRSHTQGENGSHIRSFLILFGNELGVWRAAGNGTL